MIDTKSYTIEWITDLRNKLGKRIDPKLIEKVIYTINLSIKNNYEHKKVIYYIDNELYETYDF